MSNLRKDRSQFQFNTSSPTVAATTTTLAAAVTTTGQTAITLSAAGPINGVYIQIGSEKMYVTSGGGSTNLTVTRGAWGTTASTYTNGTTVNLPGHNTAILPQIWSVPNKRITGSKVTTDINYQVVQCASVSGTDTFPGGATSIILADNTPNLGTLNVQAPGNVGQGAGGTWLQLPSAGAPGPAGTGGGGGGTLQINFSGSSAVQGKAYNGALQATGGTQPYTYTISSGSLPSGLSLSSSTGAITGTPTVAGTTTFTGEVTDASSTTAFITCTITVVQQTLGNFTVGTISAVWDSARSNGLLLTIPVSGSPAGVTGGHIYYEIPDQSSVNTGTVGSFTIGTSAPTGPWAPLEGPRLPVTAPQPWQVILPVNVSNRAINPIQPGVVIRVYVQSYSSDLDPAPIQAGLSGATPSGTVTVPAQIAAKTGSGVEYAPNIAGITAQSGVLSAVSVATAGSGYTNGTYTLADTSNGDGQGATITVTVSGGTVTAASVGAGGSGYDLVPTFSGSFAGGSGATFTCTITLTPDNSTGKLYSPVAVTADLSNLPAVLPGDFAYELVGVWDLDSTQTPIILTGPQTTSGLVPSGPDTIRTAHSFALETPSTPQWVTIYARSFTIQAVGKGRAGTGSGTIIYNRNTIVPGVTPSARVRIGVTSGTVDQSQSMPSKWGTGMEGGAGVPPKPHVTVANASAIIDALAVVDGLVGSVGLNKLAATTVTQGTAIFTGDAIFSRGTGLPLVDLASTGMFLFSTASAGSTGGNTAAPYVNITSSQVALFSGGNPSVILTGTSVTLYSVNGSTGSPYVALSSSGVTVSDGSGSHQVTINSSGVTITGGVLTSPSITVSGGSFTVNIDTTNAVKVAGLGTTVQLNTTNIYGGIQGIVCYNTSGGTLPVYIGPGSVSIWTDTTGSGTSKAVMAASSTSGSVHVTGLSGASVLLDGSTGNIILSGVVSPNGGYHAPSGAAGISATKTVSDGTLTHTVTIEAGIITGWT